MEELWKDMSLTSTPAALHYHLGSPPAAYLRHDYRLAAPQPPRTASSLEFTYLGHPASSNSTSSGDDSLHHMPNRFGTDIFSSFAATGGRNSNSNSNSSRVAVQGMSAVVSDRRQRRMVKNRESAVRSRSRKQAYTNQLELELARLKRENAMLIKRHAYLALVSGGATARHAGAPAGDFRLEIARIKKMFLGQIKAKKTACKLPCPGSGPEQRCRSAPPPSL
ncbi:unnamed protein product [Alopecurus aequalis]